MWYNLIRRVYNPPTSSIWCVETKVKGLWYDLCKGYINKNINFIDLKMQNTKLNLIKKLHYQKHFFSYLLDTVKHRDRLTLSINLSDQIKQNDAIKKLYDPNFFSICHDVAFLNISSKVVCKLNWISFEEKNNLIQLFWFC